MVLSSLSYSCFHRIIDALSSRSSDDAALRRRRRSSDAPRLRQQFAADLTGFFARMIVDSRSRIALWCTKSRAALARKMKGLAFALTTFATRKNFAIEPSRHVAIARHHVQEKSP
jgi:hypothetical protein